LGGVLVGAIGAPLAIGIDALSFVLSGTLLGRITTTEPAIPPSAGPSVAAIRRETAEGIREVWRDGRLRAIAACGMTTSVFGWGFLAIYVLFMTRELGFSPGTIGLVLTMGGIGSALGALLVGPATRRLGIGGTIIWAQLANTLGSLSIPLAILVPGWAVPMLALSEIVQWGALTLFAVVQISLRQAIVPARLQGRVTASMRTLTTGGAALGGLGGGYLGGLIGLGPALIILGLGMGLAVVWAAASPLRGLRDIPAAAG
ncbi:MAG: MFS transporter, partial [Thermomicrobiales bacterium]